MDELSFTLHMATTLGRSSLMYSIKAFSGFLMCSFLSSSPSRFVSGVAFLWGHRRETGECNLGDKMGGRSSCWN